MLFQLSYAPRGAPDHHSDRRAASVGLPWLEQGTSVLSGPRSSQLSYRPVALQPLHERLKSENQQRATLTPDVSWRRSPLSELSDRMRRRMASHRIADRPGNFEVVEREPHSLRSP
jgi:hypothetical protein